VLAEPFDQELEHVGQAEQRVSDAFKLVGRIADLRRMILLPVAQHAMAVATDRSGLSIECFTSDVMKLQGQGIVEATEWTTRVVRPKAL
jgi:hypothetical protein